jgi:hypothetical protein
MTYVILHGLFWWPGLPVPTVAVYPSFDHTDVVPKSFEMKVGWTGLCDGVDEQLKSNTLSPSDVMTTIVPATLEAPHLPSVADDDPNSNTRAGISVVPGLALSPQKPQAELGRAFSSRAKPGPEQGP